MSTLERLDVDPRAPLLSSRGVMAGLVPRSNVFGPGKNVDGRDKPGHDVLSGRVTKCRLRRPEISVRAGARPFSLMMQQSQQNDDRDWETDQPEQDVTHSILLSD
jgi:hypothetical protein